MLENAQIQNHENVQPSYPVKHFNKFQKVPLHTTIAEHLTTTITPDHRMVHPSHIIALHIRTSYSYIKCPPKNYIQWQYLYLILFLHTYISWPQLGFLLCMRDPLSLHCTVEPS